MLIDPLHVLTAGHCVYDVKLGGAAKTIKVRPATNETLGGYDRNPFGEALGLSVLAWDGWKKNRSYDHDIAIVRLDKPIGGRTGWLGYSYAYTVSWFANRTWLHDSYPAQTPYDGKRMHSQSGAFDSLPGHPGTQYEARYNRTSYDGESGSGFYKWSNGGYVSFAALSHVHPFSSGDVTDAVRLTGAKFNDVRAAILAATPTKPDLVPFSMQGSAYVPFGGSMDLSFHVLNHTSARFSGTLAYSVYLSTDQFITTNDRRLGSYRVSAQIGNNLMLEVKVPPIQLPYDVLKSTWPYHIGVIVTTADANTTNNAMEPVDTLRFETDFGTGIHNDGAGLAATDLDGNGRPELVLMGYDDPAGPNVFRYIVAWNVDASGQAQRHTAASLAGTGSTEADGAGLAATNLDADERPDLVLLAYDVISATACHPVCRVAWNMRADGRASGLSQPIKVPVTGRRASGKCGAGVAIGNIDDDPRPDMVVMAYEPDTAGPRFTYHIGWNLDAHGVARSWTLGGHVPGVLESGDGAGCALVETNGNGRPELVLVANADKPGYNYLRYWIGMDLDKRGRTSTWSGWYSRDGMGSHAGGAGMAVADLDADGLGEAMFLVDRAQPGINQMRLGIDFKTGGNVDSVAVGRPGCGP